MLYTLLYTLLACAPAEIDSEVTYEAVTDDAYYALALLPTPDPPLAGPAALEILLTEVGSGEVVEGGQVVIEPWMPEHGHGVSQQPVVTEVGGGGYEAAWSYSMPGRWELTVEVDGALGFDRAVVVYDVQ